MSELIDQCPHCAASLVGDAIPERSLELFGGATHWHRLIACIDRERDRYSHYECPDCHKRILEMAKKLAERGEAELKKQFAFRFEVEETLLVNEIWPDGDAPENPTAEDVKKAFLESCRGNVRQGLDDWGFLDGLTDVDIDIIELKPWRREEGGG